MAVTSPNLAADQFSRLNGSPTTAKTQNEQASADRFLKLLVAQLQNQDPLNPMDNAQVTTQMAQINTVEGINKLNTNVSELKDTFVQLQTMQGAALLGKEVSVNGDRLQVSGTGSAATGSGGYELRTNADRVRLEVLNASGSVVATQELGSKSAGVYDFKWAGGALAEQSGLRFRIVASQGEASVAAQPIMYGRVDSISTSGGTLKLNLNNAQNVSYADVRSVRQSG